MSDVEKAGTVSGVLAIIALCALGSTICLVLIGAIANIVWLCLRAGWNLADMVY